MRNLEVLGQFIVPLIFMIIWAITSILNRDGQPLPRRPPRPAEGGRFGERAPRDDSAPAVRPAASPGRAEAEDEFGGRPPRRPERPPASPPRRKPDGRPVEPDVYVIDDEVVFIDPATRRQIGSAALAPAKPPGRTPARPAKAAAKRGRGGPDRERERRNEPETQRVLSEQVGQSMDLTRGQGLSHSPLTANLAQLKSTSLKDASVAATVRSNDAPPSLRAEDVRKMMADGARLREMALLTELLQPPVSLRRLRRGG